MPDSPPPQTLQLKVQLRDVHPAVWRRVRVVDRLSVADRRCCSEAGIADGGAAS